MGFRPKEIIHHNHTKLMLKKKSILTILGVALAIGVQAQQGYSPMGGSGRQETGFVGNGYLESPSERNARVTAGVMYLRDRIGSVTLYQGASEQRYAQVRMNVFSNQVESQRENGGTVYYTPNLVDGFYLQYPDEVKQRHFLSVKANGFPQARFMELLSDGKMKFLKHYVVIKNAPGANAAYNTSESLNEFRLKEEYYVWVEGEEPQLFFPSKGQFKRLFKDRSPEMMDYIKSTRMRYSKIENAIKVFEAYNNL